MPHKALNYAFINLLNWEHNLCHSHAIGIVLPEKFIKTKIPK